jgi:hypothetical protein
LWNVERDGFAEVHYEVGDALGERGVDGGDHYGQRNQVIEDCSGDR